MSKARHALRAVFTLALLGAVAVLGQLPFGEPSELAAVRLALRTVEGKLEICRDRSAAELEALPQHMRTPRECSEQTVRYALTVAVDGREVLAETVAPGGLLGNRPLIADRFVPLPPGSPRLEIEFRAIRDPELSAEERAAFSQLPEYRLDREVELNAGRILLVTIDDDRNEFLLTQDP